MKQNKLIPGAILVAGVLIAGGVFLNGGGGDDLMERYTATAQSGSNALQRQVSEAHIFGNKDAPVTIVEFSDFECPYCGRLHPTIERVVGESNGMVNWEYRHFPSSRHRNAAGAAQASECIATLSGNDAFWDYASRAFENRRSLGDSFFESEAERLGIDINAFRSCMADSTIRDSIVEDLNAAIANGGRGTPFAVVVGSDGRRASFSGALSYEQLSSLVQSVQ